MYNIGYVLLPTFWGWLVSLMMCHYALKMDLINQRILKVTLLKVFRDFDHFHSKILVAILYPFTILFIYTFESRLIFCTDITDLKVYCALLCLHYTRSRRPMGDGVPQGWLQPLRGQRICFLMIALLVWRFSERENGRSPTSEVAKRIHIVWRLFWYREV